MAQGLLVSDHPLLNDLYALNLKAYLDLSLTVVTDIDDALNIIDLDAQGDIIISLSQVEEKDSGKIILEHLEKKDNNCPFILIGENSAVSDVKRIVNLPANLNISLVIRKCAEILGVTAKEMASKKVNDFYPIPISMLECFSEAPCDIYTKVSKVRENSQFAKIIQEDEENQEYSHKKRIEKYRGLGIKQLYIPSGLRLKVVNLASEIVLKTLDDSKNDHAEMLKASEQGFEIVADFLGAGEKVSEEVVEISRKCMETMKNTLKKVPRLGPLLKQLVENKSGYLYLHAIVGIYISRHIIKNISWGSEEHSEKLSFVFFFHDIFLSPIFAAHPDLKYEEDMLLHSDLSEDEKETILNHARLASEAVKTFPRCPLGADTIILQHHGTSNGVGFTIEYKDDTSPLAKVLLISESFVEELIKERSNGMAKTLVSEIVNKLHLKFPNHTYKKIINCLDTIAF